MSAIFVERRDALRMLVVLGASTLACGKKEVAFTCSDQSTLSADEIQVRTKLSYIDHSPDPEKSCDRCQQWIASPSSGTCGGCKVMKGPIHPRGTCRLFGATS